MKNAPWLIVSLVLFSLGNPADAAKPKSGGSSWSDCCEEIREHQKDLYVDLLRKKGKPSNLWVSDAVKFLTSEANYVAVEGGALSEERLLAANLLYGRGCRDPIFLFRLAAIQQQQEKDAEAAKTLEQALAGLPKTNYAGFIRLIILSDLATLHAKLDGGKRAKEFRDQLPAAILDALKDGYIERENADFAFLHVKGALDSLTPAELAPLPEKVLAVSGADEWIALTVAGYAEVRQVLPLLKPGADGAISEETKTTIKKHLGAARKSLTKAYELEKGHASAPAAMIVVAAGDPLPDEKPRVWFDRAVAANYNAEDPYIFYGIAVSPLFGGTLDAVLEFGLECAKSNRFDTQKPIMLAGALKMVVMFSNGSMDVYSRPGVFAEYRRVVEEREKYVKKKGEDASYLRLYYTDLICIACKIGLKDEATSLLKEHEEDLLPSVLAEHGETKTSLLASLRPAAPAVSASPPMASNAPGPSSGNSRRGSSAGGLDVSQWNIVSGKFDTDRKGAIVAKTTSAGAIAFLPDLPGPRFEVVASIDEMLPSGDNIKRAAILLGDPGSNGKSYLVVEWQAANLMIVIRPNSGTGKVTYRRCHFKLPGKLVIRVWDGWLYVFTEDTLVAGTKIDYFPLSSPLVGVGIPNNRIGASATFSAIDVRALDTEPNSDAARFHPLADTAYALASEGKLDEAIKVFANASPFGGTGYVPEMFDFIPRSFENRQRVKIGETVDMLAFGKKAGDWRGNLDQWETTADGFVSKPLKGANRRELAIDLTDYEVSGKMEWESKAGSDLWIEVQVGLRNARHLGAILYRPTAGLYFSAHKPNLAEATKIRPAGNETSLVFSIRKQGDKLSILENGKVVATLKITEIEHSLHGSISMNVFTGKNEPTSKVKFTNMKFTPLASQ